MEDFWKPFPSFYSENDQKCRQNFVFRHQAKWTPTATIRKTNTIRNETFMGKQLKGKKKEKEGKKRRYPFPSIRVVFGWNVMCENVEGSWTRADDESAGREGPICGWLSKSPGGQSESANWPGEMRRDGSFFRRLDRPRNVCASRLTDVIFPPMPAVFRAHNNPKPKHQIYLKKKILKKKRKKEKKMNNKTLRHNKEMANRTGCLVAFLFFKFHFIFVFSSH